MSIAAMTLELDTTANWILALLGALFADFNSLRYFSCQPASSSLMAVSSRALCFRCATSTARFCTIKSTPTGFALTAAAGIMVGSLGPTASDNRERRHPCSSRLPRLCAQQPSELDGLAWCSKAWTGYPRQRRDVRVTRTSDELLTNGSSSPKAVGLLARPLGSLKPGLPDWSRRPRCREPRMSRVPFPMGFGAATAVGVGEAVETADRQGWGPEARQRVFRFYITDGKFASQKFK
ncbi:hypothetical protein GMORB2_0419 [Geosmithia morbida]|uniref:Uncharacterized protein n=1 Tax=Geosmithia morbida TaxID=1094350 RepID=A0A9P4Z0Y2_9HYPO|nr:uncharacterized protein GMORB2_0419 [Geosmithia morbida]KAF4126683.1 hypothetical protein GMORB2_0419 [Geosmithia morbida]